MVQWVHVWWALVHTSYLLYKWLSHWSGWYFLKCLCRALGFVERSKDTYQKGTKRMLPENQNCASSLQDTLPCNTEAALAQAVEQSSCRFMCPWARYWTPVSVRACVNGSWFWWADGTLQGTHSPQCLNGWMLQLTSWKVLQSVNTGYLTHKHWVVCISPVFVTQTNKWCWFGALIRLCVSFRVLPFFTNMTIEVTLAIGLR